MSSFFRPFRLIFVLSTSTLLYAQQAPAPAPAGLSAALAGRWTGVLEYRDYKEPASSSKRVTLPTWLSIDATKQTEAWHYIYDDGPGKVVEDNENVAFDIGHETCTIQTPGKPPRTYSVTGYNTLESGRGTLVLNGTGTDNGKPADMRLTLVVGRNIFSLLEEVRASGTQEAFAYRHLYRFVRAEAPSK